MQSLFGRIKEKFVKVTTPAQEQLGNLRDMISSLQNTTKSFDTQQTNKRLAVINENCNKWQVYIINESSTGLFYCQNHNRKCIEAKAKANTESVKKISKRRLTLEQIERTQKDLDQLNALSKQWCGQLSRSLQPAYDKS